MNSNDRVNEGLSALADGETNELETARLLKQVKAKPELRKRWERLHLIGAILRGEEKGYLPLNFAESLNQKLEAEAHVLVPVRTATSSNAGSRSWLKPVAGFAIAATVAMVSILGLRAFDSPGEPQQLVEAQPNTLIPSSPKHQLYAGGTRWNLQRVDLEQRLNNYLLNHMEYARIGEMQGMLPYSRLAGYDTSQ